MILVDKSALEFGKHKCLKCAASFDTIQFMKFHMTEVHAVMFPQHCNLCNISFANYEESQVHRFQVHGMFCSVCGRAFLKVNLLENHMRKVHGSPIEYPCTICGSIEFTEARFAEHLEAHQSLETETLVFRCDLCRKPFFDAAELQSHAKIHDNARQCPCCQEIFTTAPMKRHMRKFHAKEVKKIQKNSKKLYKRFIHAEKIEWKKRGIIGAPI